MLLKVDNLFKSSGWSLLYVQAGEVLKRWKKRKIKREREQEKRDIKPRCLLNAIIQRHYYHGRGTHTRLCLAFHLRSCSLDGPRWRQVTSLAAFFISNIVSIECLNMFLSQMIIFPMKRRKVINVLRQFINSSLVIIKAYSCTLYIT